MGFWKTFLACLSAIVVSSILSFIFSIIIIIGFFASLASLGEQSYTVGDNSVLVVDLNTNFVEKANAGLLDNFNFSTMSTNDNMSVYDAVRAIENAAVDPRIKGVYVKVPMVIPSSLTTLYEIRTALKNFKDQSSGDKFTVAFGDGYSQGALYLSSVCDQVYLNPAGAVDWSGMSSSVMFFKGAMDKLGIEPQIIRHGQFKGAVEPFMLTELSAENRLQTEQLLGSMWGYVVGQVASSRDVDSTALQMAATELTAITPDGAMKAGLVDSLLYKDQVTANIENLVGHKPNYVTVAEYKRSVTNLNEIKHSTNKIALIYADGDIGDVSSGSSTEIVGNDLAADIRRAREDDNVKSIVLRVNSPGGSVLASDIIYREVYLARQIKPVVVSMGAYGASGGYWISCPADAIVVSPTTITGSIGVFGLLFNVQKGAREKLGVTVDIVSTNPSADMGSIFRSLSPLERTFVQNQIDTTYLKFINLVALGRDLPVDSVDAMGGGRVWSGLQAVERGLANSCGTLGDAIVIASEKAGIENDYSVRVFNEDKNSFFALFNSLSSKVLTSIFGGNSEAAQKALQVDRILKTQGVRAAMPYQIIIEK